MQCFKSSHYLCTEGWLPREEGVCELNVSSCCWSVPALETCSGSSLAGCRSTGAGGAARRSAARTGPSSDSPEPTRPSRALRTVSDLLAGMWMFSKIKAIQRSFSSLFLTGISSKDKIKVVKLHILIRPQTFVGFCTKWIQTLTLVSNRQ